MRWEMSFFQEWAVFWIHSLLIVNAFCFTGKPADTSSARWAGWAGVARRSADSCCICRACIGRSWWIPTARQRYPSPVCAAHASDRPLCNQSRHWHPPVSNPTRNADRTRSDPNPIRKWCKSCVSWDVSGPRWEMKPCSRRAAPGRWTHRLTVAPLHTAGFWPSVCVHPEQTRAICCNWSCIAASVESIPLRKKQTLGLPLGIFKEEKVLLERNPISQSSET